MPTFHYKAIDAARGRERTGSLASTSVDAAARTLKTRGLAPLELRPSATEEQPIRARPLRKSTAFRAPRVFGRPVSRKSVAYFTRQLSTLLRAGLPLVRALETLTRQEKSPLFRGAIEDLAATIRNGGNLSAALAQHPAIFDRLYVNLVRAGEAGGVLGLVLERVAQFQEKAERVRGKVKSALTYPIVVLLLATAIVAALLVFVVPQFEQIFAGMLKGQPLPALTRGVLAISVFLQQHALLALVVAAGGIAGLVAFRRTGRGERLFDLLALRLPVIGDLSLKSAVSRVTRTFGPLLSSGVPMLEALAITRDTAGNVHISAPLERVREQVKSGDSVARPLAASGVFPPLLASMVEVGEETGALPEMLGRIADAYDDEVDQAVAALTSIIEPCLIILLAAVVGTIVIALFLPIVSIIQHLQ